MLDMYLSMNAIWSKKGPANEYGEASYTNRNIKCRIVEKFKEVTNEKGDKVIANSIIQCVEPIKVGDKINDKRVEAVNSMTMLDSVVGYRGYLL